MEMKLLIKERSVHVPGVHEDFLDRQQFLAILQ